VLFGVQESGAFQLCAHLGVERLDVRPDGRDRKAGLSGPKRAQVVLGGGAKKRAAVGDLVDGAEAGEPPEGPEEVPARERPDGVAVGGILLPADFREAGDRHPGIALEAAQGVAGFDGGVLFCVADQQQPVVVGRRQTAEIAHLADRHESGLVHDDGAPAQRGLQRCVDEQLLERVRMRGQFAAEHVGRAGRGRATEDPAPGALDAGDDGAQAGGLAGAGRRPGEW
jgi:hypothetical protein